MDRVVDLLGYLEDWPPAHVILSIVHRPEGSLTPAMSPDEELRDIGALASEIGATGSPSPLPSWLRQMADEAGAIANKAKKK